MKLATALAVAMVMVASGMCAAADTDEIYELIKMSGGHIRWAPAKSDGDPVITYSFLERNAEYPSARNCAQMGPFAEALKGSDVDIETARGEIAQAFKMWSDVVHIEFREVAYDANAEPDITIGAQSVPVGYAFTDVHAANQHSAAIRELDRSLICLNPRRSWKIGFDGKLNSYDIRYTLAHEIGHAIGLDHPSSTNQLMSFRYQEAFRELQAGDINGAALLYGARSSETPQVHNALGASADADTSLRGDLGERLGLFGRQ